MRYENGRVYDFGEAPLEAEREHSQEPVFWLGVMKP